MQRSPHLPALAVMYLVIGLFSLIAYFHFPHLPIRNVDSSAGTGALEALSLWSAQRAYPGREIPPAGYVQAFEQRKKLAKMSQAVAAVPPWESLGPFNVGGRTLSIAINPANPSTIYVGSASGGLWKTHTAGVGTHAWHPVPTGFPVLGVNTIVLSPVDTNLILIGTGEVYRDHNSTGGLGLLRTTRGSYGLGILKSEDAGRTWRKTLDWSYNQQRGVQQLRMNPKNDHTIYAGTTEGTFKSTDAGETWTRVHPVRMVTDIVIHPVDTNIVFIACGNFSTSGHGIYRSVDGGAHWQKLSNGLPRSYSGKTMLAIYQANPRFIYADIANTLERVGLYRSTDGGDNWTRLSGANYAAHQGWYSHFVVVHPRDSTRLILGGVHVWTSNDGGHTVTRRSGSSGERYLGEVPPGGPEGSRRYSHADHHNYAIDPNNPERVYFVNDGGIFRTDDFGRTFTGLNGGYTTTQFYNGFASDQDDSSLAIGGTQDNGVLIFHGSTTWYKSLGGDGTWNAIDPLVPTILYTSTQRLNIRRSNDGGKINSWRTIMNGIGSGDANFISPFVLAPSARSVLYAGKDLIYKTTTAGGSWFVLNGGRKLDSNPVLAMAVSPNGADTVYVTNAGGSTRTTVFVTMDGGASWRNITGTLPNRYPVDISIDPNDARRVFVAMSGFGSSHLFKSTNAGQSWIDIGAGLPDVPTSAVVVDPAFPHHIYAGNDLGVYVSIDDGETWERFDSGFPEAAIVMDLSISSSNRKLRAVTHGRGVYQRPLVGRIPTQVAQRQRIPFGFELLQNYPNPFSAKRGGTFGNPGTSIAYKLARDSDITLSVYDTRGREVERLFAGKQQAGEHHLVFDGSNLSSGIYFLRLQTQAGLSLVRRMVFIK